VWLPEVFGKTPLQTPGTPQHRLMRTVLHALPAILPCASFRPLHDRSFDLRTGKNLSGDCTDVRTYPVVLRQDGGIVLSG